MSSLSQWYRAAMLKRNAFIRKYGLLRWLFLTKENQVAIIQWPNAPLSVAIFLALVSLVAPGFRSYDIILAFIVTLLVWSIMEIISGVNPFRRLLGMAVFITELMRFFMH